MRNNSGKIYSPYSYTEIVAIVCKLEGVVDIRETDNFVNSKLQGNSQGRSRILSYYP